MGKLLNPGESITTIGLGDQPWYKRRDTSVATSKYDTIMWKPNYLMDSTGYPPGYDSTGRLIYPRDTTIWKRKTDGRQSSFCFNYRLGILDKYPLGKGLEFGFHMEAPVPSEGGGSMVLEFDLRSGLPPAVVGNAVFNHNVGLGWMVGMWVDNGWYAEYAAGLEYKHLVPYTSIRLLYTATDLTGDQFAFENANFFKKHSQYLNIRQCLGCAIKIPRLPVLPDYIVPEMTLAYPNYDRFQSVGFTYHVGLRWLNGL
jgi:hypothetical protein